MTPGRGSVTETHGRVRRHLVRDTWLTGVVWAGAALAGVLILAWIFAGADGWRAGSVGPLTLDAALVALMVILFVTARRAVSRWMGTGSVASSMEVATGLPPGSVLGSLELARGVPRGVSPGLAALAQHSVAEKLGGDERRLAGPLGARTRSRKVRSLQGLALFGVAAAVLGGATPERALPAWQGLSKPLAALTVPALPPLRVRPGDVEILRGSTLDVEVEAPGREQVTLSWRVAGEVVQRRTNQFEGGITAFTLPAVSSPVQYWVEAPDGARSSVFRITPVDPLFISDLSVELTFPAHTGRVPEEFRGEVPPLEIPVGTRLEIDGRSSRILGAARLVLAEDEAEIPMEVNGDRFGTSWYPGRSGTYAWQIRDEAGSPAESAPPPLQVTLVPDSAPRVDLVMPGVDTVLSLSMKEPLAIQVSDDYGVDLVELIAYRVDAFGQRGEPVIQRLDLGGVGAALARPILDVSEWGLVPGDTVRYLARAVDNNPRAQAAQTREYVLRMPGSTELSRAAQRRLEETADQLEELTREAERVNEETRQLDRQAEAREGQRGGPEDTGRAGFEEREEFQRALEQQSELDSQVDSIRAELEELARSLEDRGMSDPELREDMEELQDLLDELMDEDARERMQQLQESLENITQEQIDQALKEMAERQEEFRQQLEESLEQFRRAAVEQDFRATTDEAQELAQQESAVADAMEEGTDPQRRAEQQDALEQRAQELDQRMETLEERLDRLDEQEASQQVQEARQQAQQSREAMQQAAQMARSGQQQQGAENAEQAADRMQEAADQLSQAQQNMDQGKAQQIREAFQQASSDAMALARQQAEVREQMRGATPQEMAELRGDQAAVQQGIRNMAENLSRDAGAAGGGPDRELMERMGDALQQAQRTLESMEGQQNGAPSPRTTSEAVVNALNEVALVALAAGGDGGQGEAGGEGQPQMSEALESLAQQQGSLMNQTGALVPMQLGEQARQRQMEEIAEGQEQVGNDLNDMAQRPDPDGQALGDLEALAQEAQALADLLAQGRLDPETLRRQERLFHRLLDAGRTLQRDEESTERQSERAGEFERPTVLPLTLEALDAFQYALPDAAALNRLPPAQRQLVIDYFERLNRERPRGPGGPSR